MLPILAQVAALTLVHWIIIAIVVAGVIGIAIVVFRQAGISVPAWAVQIFWIVAVVVVAILAIKFILTML